MTMNMSRLPFLAFAGGDDAEALKQFAAAHSIPPECVEAGDIRTATQFLKSNPSPEMLLVEIPSAQEASGLIDALADVCEPDTKVVITGHVNEYSFYCWLTEIGVFSYLLKPLTPAMVEGVYQKAHAPVAEVGKLEKPKAKVIAVTGARGGVGASTIALNLAALLAEYTSLHIALVDVDPQDGCLALQLDVEPSRGLREALERPERIDDLFVERVMHKVSPNLSVLCAEESMQDKINTHEQTSKNLMNEVRSKFDVVVLDVPRNPTGLAKQCLKEATQVVLVADMSLPSLRDVLRISDAMRETLGLPQPLVLANRVGAAPKQELRKEDFEKGIGTALAASIAYAPDVFMGVGLPVGVVKHKQHAAAKALHAFAGELEPSAKPVEEKRRSLFWFLDKSGKD
jgi:pilus assembly protein CpaE